MKGRRKHFTWERCVIVVCDKWWRGKGRKLSCSQSQGIEHRKPLANRILILENFFNYRPRHDDKKSNVISSGCPNDLRRSSTRTAGNECIENALPLNVKIIELKVVLQSDETINEIDSVLIYTVCYEVYESIIMHLYGNIPSSTPYPCFFLTSSSPRLSAISILSASCSDSSVFRPLVLRTSSPSCTRYTGRGIFLTPTRRVGSRSISSSSEGV